MAAKVRCGLLLVMLLLLLLLLTEVVVLVVVLLLLLLHLLWPLLLLLWPLLTPAMSAKAHAGAGAAAGHHCSGHGSLSTGGGCVCKVHTDSPLAPPPGGCRQL